MNREERAGSSRRILFVTPPYHCGVVEVAGRWIPLHYVYLAGAARAAGFEPAIYDAMSKDVGFEEIERAVAEFEPAYLAVGAITATLPDSLEILRRGKCLLPSVTTILGGVHPSFMYHEALAEPAVDYVVRGEGEITLAELLTALDQDRPVDDIPGLAFRRSGEVKATAERPFLPDLDQLQPAWDLLDWDDYRYFVIPGSRLAAVSTSRGCDHDCTFCSQQKFWKQTRRQRRPERVVEEIEFLHQRYGVTVILIADEYPTADRERWEQILDRLIARQNPVKLLMETRVEDIVRDEDLMAKYRQAGVVHIYIGIEAGEQKTLDRMKKDLQVDQSSRALEIIHRHGMVTETSFVLGFPEETKSSVQRTLRTARFYNPDFAHFLAIAPWPYADLYPELEPFIQVRDYRKYNLIDPVVKPRRMTLSQVDEAIVECYRKFYLGKLKEVARQPDPFKRDYLLRSFRLIMQSSFLKQKMGSLGAIPARMEKALRELKIA